MLRLVWKTAGLESWSSRNYRVMPNKDNVTRPVLLIGAGRTSSSYVQDRLNWGLGKFHSVIENDLYRDVHKAIAEAGWCYRYKYVGEPADVRSRIVQALRGMFVTVFSSDLDGWSMKCIWSGHDPELLNELFPDARYIHLLRDPRTNIPSMMERLGYSFEDACNAYCESNENALQFNRFGARYLRIRQEEFVDSREKTWVNICAFLGVDFVEGVWERELNASSSTVGRVNDKRVHDRLTWQQLPARVVAMGKQLGYVEGPTRARPE